MKSTFQEEQVGWFHCILKFKIVEKLKLITVRYTVKMWILSSVATLKAHKSASGVENILL